MGEVEVPEDAYYGAFTVRAEENFDLSRQTAHREFIRALGQIKKVAARANLQLGLMKGETSQAILQASQEVIDGEHDDEFVLDHIQAGAGTPFHMNANEVIANRATEILGGEKGEYRVHPNDDVNMGQSSNNVIPTAVRLATMELADDLIREIEGLASAFETKSQEYDDTVKVGRTHLQDAVPITLGQEFAAWADMCYNGVERLEKSMQELRQVGLGGNAIGTGINTPANFRQTVVEELSDETGRNLWPAEGPRAVTQSMAPFANFMGSLKSFVTDMIKVADDLMLLSSGPVAGLGELELPEVEPGSSIMPGKVNPSIVEAFKMSCFQVLGNDEAVSMAAKEGDLELNVMAPVIAKNLFEALDVMRRATAMLRERCVEGIEADEERIDELFSGSTATATALNPYLGYDLTADVVKEALESDSSIREAVIDRGYLTEAEADKLLDPGRMTRPSGVDEELKEKIRDRLESEE